MTPEEQIQEFEKKEEKERKRKKREDFISYLLIAGFLGFCAGIFIGYGIGLFSGIDKAVLLLSPFCPIP